MNMEARALRSICSIPLLALGLLTMIIIITALYYSLPLLPRGQG